MLPSDFQEFGSSKSSKTKIELMDFQAPKELYLL